MEHKQNCKFEETINQLKERSFIIGEGEISGFIDVDFDSVSFDDGWNPLPSIYFKYCPFCGVELKKNNNE